jgi:hypothetical protein
MLERLLYGWLFMICGFGIIVLWIYRKPRNWDIPKPKIKESEIK